jgi:hypothetical protein
VQKGTMKTYQRVAFLSALVLQQVTCLTTFIGYTVSAQKVEPFGSVYYSAQKPWLPPMPYNPFPEFPTIGVGPKRFVYDDTQVDYVALQEQSFMMTASAPPAPGGGGGGGGTNSPPIYYPAVPIPGVPMVGIARNPSGGFFLDVSNMTVGSIYGVVTKPSLDPDPFNTWSLGAVFQAVGETERFSGSATAPMRVYAAADLDEYAGPQLQIVSPTSGSTVSGDVPVQVWVSDVFRLFTVEVFVGPTLAGSIQPGQGGVMRLPSHWFANGPQQIWVRAVNEGAFVDTDDDGAADSPTSLQAWANVSVNFANGVYMANYSPLYSSFGSITLDYVATTPHNYTFEVSRLNGQLLHTQSGSSSGGNINPTWNFTDLSGNPVNDSGYVFSLTPTPQGGAAAAAPIKTINFFDKGVTVGQYVISFGEYTIQSHNEWMETMNHAVSSRANFAAYLDEDIIGSNREAHGIIYSDFHSDPYRIRAATQTNDLTSLTNALKDPLVGAWLWQGHAGTDYIIPGQNTSLNVRLSAKDVASLLGNDISWPNTTNLFYKRRLHYTINAGCGTVNGKWPIAVGTPPGVPQEGNPWIKKSAFLGFVGQSLPGETKMRWLIRIHDYWIDGSDYDTLFKTAVDWSNLDFPDVVAWAPQVVGYRFIRYNGAGSR